MRQSRQLRISRHKQANKTNAWRDQLEFSKNAIGVIALLSLPIFAFRALVVADFNSSVATALVANTSPATVISATLLMTIPLVSLIGTVVVTCYIIKYGLQHNWLPWKRFVLTFPALLLLLPGLLVSSADLMTLLMIIPFFATVSGFIEDHYAGRGSTKIMIFGILSLCLISFFISSAMWLAPERIEIQRRAQTLYVLDSTESTLIVFDQKNNVVRRIPGKDVKNRQFCEPVPRIETFSTWLFGEPKGRPLCPS